LHKRKMKNMFKFTPNSRISVIFAFSFFLTGCRDDQSALETGLIKSYSQGYEKPAIQTADPLLDHVDFIYSPAEGLGPQPNVCRRDNSDIIKVGDTYYVWYSKVRNEPNVYMYPSGYSATVWYATSQDGHKWEEKGQALAVGKPGAWDEGGVYTPNILRADGKYYLTYDGAAKNHSEQSFCGEGMAISDSPDGPWRRIAENPLNWPIKSDDPNCFNNFRVCDACLLIRDGKYWWYYKGRGENKTPFQTRMGVAVADSPAGPYIKHDGPITNGGHEVLCWPYREGVMSLVTQCGPDKDTVQYALDGINFKICSHFTDPPMAPGAYRPDAFTNSRNARQIEWGLSMKLTKDPYLVRFDCQWSSGDKKAVTE
jgi:hypothetical protein